MLTWMEMGVQLREYNTQSDQEQFARLEPAISTLTVVFLPFFNRVNFLEIFSPLEICISMVSSFGNRCILWRKNLSRTLANLILHFFPYFPLEAASLLHGKTWLIFRSVLRWWALKIGEVLEGKPSLIQNSYQ